MVTTGYSPEYLVLKLNVPDTRVAPDADLSASPTALRTRRMNSLLFVFSTPEAAIAAIGMMHQARFHTTARQGHFQRRYRELRVRSGNSNAVCWALGNVGNVRVTFLHPLS